MPRIASELSAIEVKRLAAKPGFWAVGGVAGLHLIVNSTASWILRVLIGGKRTDLGFGPYPEVSLARAREKAAEARDLIRQGRDPREEKKAAQAALRAAQARTMTFKAAAIQCHEAKATEFRNRKHRTDWLSSLERYAFDVIGPVSVAEIELAHVVNVLTPIWAARTETATRVRQRIEKVLDWAIVSGYRPRQAGNPAQWRGTLEHALPKPSKLKKVNHRAALAFSDVPGFMAALRQREGMGARALEFAILTAARSGEVRLSTWDEVDMKAKVWTIPGKRMKASKAHRVPLSAPAVKLLKSLSRFEDSPYVFPAVRGGALSDMSISGVCRRMAVEAVPHGFRSSFKDWARSVAKYPDEVSELALAHVANDATRAAYARDALLPQRAKLMRDWARFCGSKPPRKGKVDA